MLVLGGGKVFLTQDIFWQFVSLQVKITPPPKSWTAIKDLGLVVKRNYELRILTNESSHFVTLKGRGKNLLPTYDKSVQLKTSNLFILWKLAPYL